MSTVLRKPGSNMPVTSPQVGERDRGTLGGAGATRSCDHPTCLTHGRNANTGGGWISLPALSPGQRPRRRWYCNRCLERRAQRQQQINTAA